MYAQLCLRLVDTSPNFEAPRGQTTTFHKILLHKCREEFEKRRLASAVFDRQNALSFEEAEERSVAKRKMLGNIKFVGELYKLGMLHEAIIHSCIKELLEKRRHQSYEESCESIECLCRFLTTVGRKLDTEKARSWIDKYFERVQSIVDSATLPPRIRFMLMDLKDLRRDKWVPRREHLEELPRPISAIRQEMHQSASSPVLHPHSRHSYSSAAVPQGTPPPHKPVGGDEGFPPPPNRHSEAAPPTAPGDSPAGRQGHERRLQRALPVSKSDGNVSLRPSSQPLRPAVSVRSAEPKEEQAAVPHTSTPHTSTPHTSTPHTSTPHSSTPHTSTPHTSTPHLSPPKHSADESIVSAAEEAYFMPRVPFFPPPPHLPPPHILPPHPLPPLPPQTYNPAGMVGGFPIPPVLPPRAYFRSPQAMPPYHMMGPGFVPMPVPRFLQQWGPVAVDAGPRPSAHTAGTGSSGSGREDVKKHASAKGGRKGGGGGGGKNPRDKNEKRVEAILVRYLELGPVGMEQTAGALAGVEGLPREALCCRLMALTLERSEDDRTRVSELFHHLHQTSFILSSDFLLALSAVVLSIASHKAVVPQCTTYIAGYIARAIAKGVVSLKDVAGTIDLCTYHPMALVTLQALMALIGEKETGRMFQSSGVKLASLFPPSLSSHSAIISLIDARGLGFLYPLRRVESALAACLKRESSPSTIYRWIKENVDSSYHCSHEFVSILTKSILEHVTCGATLGCGRPAAVDQASALEKTTFNKWKVLVHKFVIESVPLQVTVLYSTQVFCHCNGFPKGMLRRLFSYWYDTDVVDEEAFFKWKEDISQEHPGKGEALFQVNQWLLWLAEAESEQSSSSSSADES